MFIILFLVDKIFLNSWWSLIGAFELGTVEFLLVVEPLNYYSYNFYSTFLPQVLLLLHQIVPPTIILF